MKHALLLILAALLVIPLACGQNLSSSPASTTATPTSTLNTGASWVETTSSAAFPARALSAAVTYNNLMWVMGGVGTGNTYFNDVWLSPDGLNWSESLANTSSPGVSQFPQRIGHTAVAAFNQMWVIGGINVGASRLNDVWSSSNGNTWTQVLADTGSPGSNQFPERSYFSSLVFNNLIWVIAGNGNSSAYFNDVWYSSNGSTWTQALSNNSSPGSNQFPQRYGCGSVVYKNLMWVIGGGIPAVPPNNLTNDVWASPDGVTWTKVLANNASPGSTQFSQRVDHTVLVYNNLLWVIGGSITGGTCNDAWYSSDGITWTQALANNALPGTNQFTERSAMASVVFNNFMWLFGGQNSGGNYDDDVWQTH
jgi:hypothetical protein